MSEAHVRQARCAAFLWSASQEEQVECSDARGSCSDPLGNDLQFLVTRQGLHQVPELVV